MLYQFSKIFKFYLTRKGSSINTESDQFYKKNYEYLTFFQSVLLLFLLPLLLPWLSATSRKLPPTKYMEYQEEGGMVKILKGLCVPTL
jgi:hypothetical protein